MSKDNKAGWTDEIDLGSDWDAVSTEAPPPLEVGLYRAEITKAYPEKSKGGKPMIKLELNVTRKYGDEADSMNRKAFDQIMLSAEAKFRIKQLCEAADVAPPAPKNGRDKLTFEDFEDFSHELVGTSVFLKSKLETYEGKTNHKVDRYCTEAKARDLANGVTVTSSEEEAPVEGGARRRRRAS